MSKKINNLSKVKKEDCALIIIDMQNDFISEGAAVKCEGSIEIVPNVVEARTWAHQNDIPVVYTQETHRHQKVDFGLELERSEAIHCVDGTWGCEIVDELAPTEKDYVMVKRRYSGYYLTDLELLMKGWNKNVLIITGAATNVCVYATALDAMQRDTPPIVLSDCVAGTTAELHDSFLKNIDYVLGDVVTLSELKIELG